MKKTTLFLLALAMACPAARLLAWSRIGHDTIAAIAESQLTPKARATVEKYLGGRSIIYFASWMDEVRDTPEYKHTARWHAAAPDKNLRNDPAARAKIGGDCVTAAKNCIALLKGHAKLDPKIAGDNIKFLIHIIGDMHCPGHVKYADVNTDFSVKLLGRKLTYHELWDSGLLYAIHNWSYSEYLRHLGGISVEERAAMSRGTPDDWFHETAVDSRVIYDWAGPGASLDRDYTNKAQGLAEKQLVKAGCRLARALNELFE